MYQSLETLFHIDERIYEKEYKMRINSSYTKKLDFNIEGNQAFFVECDEVTSLTYEILKNDKELTKLSNLYPSSALKAYSNLLLINEILYTNLIEGINSSKKELNTVLDFLNNNNKSETKHYRFLGLVKKYSKLIENENIDLSTCKDIRDLYDEIVLEEVLNENINNIPDGLYFRKETVEIKTSTGKLLHKGLYPEKAIIDAMQKALNFMHSKILNNLYTACIFHFIFEYIHPFYDGNGRIGRFILSYELSKELEFLLSYKISETISENIKSYYKAFEICTNKINRGDLTPFLIMMLKMIKIASNDLIKDLKDNLNRYNETIDYLNNLNSKQNECFNRLCVLLAQATYFSEDGLSTSKLIKDLNISFNTLKTKLNILDKRNLLYIKKIGKEKYYMLNINEINDVLNFYELKLDDLANNS